MSADTLTQLLKNSGIWVDIDDIILIVYKHNQYSQKYE